MISNMHIPWDWNRLINHSPYKRVSTLCRTKTVPEHVAIPGFIDQPTLFKKPRGVVPGWCRTCQRAMALDVQCTFVKESEYMLPEVLSIYRRIASALNEQAADWNAVVDASKTKDKHWSYMNVVTFTK